MGLMDRQREYFERVNGHLASLCRPDDPLVGAFVGSQSSAFSNKIYAVGVTRHFMVIQQLDKRQQPQGPPLWLQPSDIAGATIWGEGGGFREWLAHDSEYQLRFTTTGGEKYKILALGGWTMSKAMGPDYIAGLEAVANWLAACQRR